MLEYNGKKNILYAYKNALARPQLEVESENDVVYKSFLEYKNGQCAEDVMEVFLPAMHQALKCQPEALSIQPGRIEIKQVDKGYFNDMTYHVCVHFHVAGADDSNADDVTIIKLPMVDSNGIIEYEGRKYAFIHMLEQEPTVSFEANEATSKAATLKIKNGKRSIWIDDDAKRIRFRMSDRNGKSSKTKYTLIDLIAAMAKDEGLDIYKIWDEFANFTICNMFKDETDKTCHLEYYGMNTGSVNAIDYSQELVPRLTLQRLTQSGVGDISYDNTTIREDINRLLSLDRAVGETLAKDVYSVLRPNIKLAEIGTTIDENLIDVFNSEGVYCVYVNCMPNIEGYYLAEDVYITYAPPGLKLTSDIREHFPDEKGMYLSRYYDKIPVPIIYSEGDALTMSMIETIAAFGMDNVKVSDKKSGGVVKTLNFYEEIMSNKQFLGDKIGKESGVWYYLNKDNVFVQNKGSYTTYDFIALQSFCVKLFEGKWIGKVINADAGFRKQLVPLSEQYRRAFAHAVREGFKKMNRKYKTIWGSNKIFFHQRDNMDNNFYPLSKAFWEYLRDEAKCLVALQNDNVHNPIAYQSACTKVNVYTANKHSIADSQREIAIGSYGKIDPYEIPQSQKLGTVYNSTCGSQISTDGVMKTLYYELIHLGGISKILKNRIISLTSAQEEQYVIADICSLDFDESGIITNNNANVLCRVPSIGTAEKQTFANKKIKEIKYVNINATQPLSWASSTIPFMGSNDAARAIFAVAQEKQAKGIINPEEPDVMTSAYEQFSWLNDKFGIRAKSDGVVDYINYNSIEEEYTMGVLYEGQDGINSGTDYTFKEFFDSGYSVTKLNVLVKKGDKFKKGDMLVSSNFISENGILQFGRNALVAFHCDGYNYEDGSHISQSMCESLASYRINKVTYTGSPEHTKSYRLKKYPIGRWLSKDEGSNITVTYEDSRYFGREEKSYPVEKAYGFFEGYDPIKAEHKKSNYGVEVSLVSVDKFNHGDKASNRHGNKGVLSRSEPTANMPRLMNGMPIDVSLNPLGVGSRMNIGQIKEAHCGLFAHVLKIKLSTDAYNAISDEEISTLMALTVDLMDSTGDCTNVLQQYKGKVPDGLLEHCKNVIDDIRIYAGCFNKRGTTKLILPDNEGALTETEVLIGYIYIFKLIQEAYKKVHARGNEVTGEPYGELTDAPTHGSSKGGGQRFGTMEMDAVCAYGASAYIQELTNERCDNAIARNNLYVNTYLPGRLREHYLIPEKGQRRSVTQFLYSMLALGVMCEPDDGEFLPLSKDNGTELAHWKASVIQRAGVNYNKNFTKKEDEVEGSVERSHQDEVNNTKNLIFGGGN